MAKQTINVGSSVNRGDGDPLRTAFSKVNNNFDELYTALGLGDDALNLGAFEFNGSTLTTTDSTRIVVDQEVLINSDLTMKGNVMPNADGVHDLGSPEKEWRSLYVSENTIYLGGKGLGIDENNNLTIDGAGVTISTDWNAVTNKPEFFDGDYASLSNTPTIPTAVSELTNDAGYITSADIADGTLTVDVNNTGDLQGSVFADDSTILVDGVAGKIRGDIESATVNITSTVGDVNITAADDIDLETTGANADIRLTSSDNIRLFSVSDTNITSNSYVSIFTDASNSLHNFIFSETGYFEALADTGGININNELNFNSGGSPTATMKLNSTILEVENTGGFRLKDSGGNTQLEYLNESAGVLNVAGTINGTLNGDVTGSVFADDSTLLVDGVNGVIPYGVLDGAPTALSDFSNDLDYAAIVATQIQTNGLPIGTEASGLFASDGQSLVLGYKDSNGTAWSHISLSEANSIQIQADVTVSAATTFDFNSATVNNLLLNTITSGDTAPGSAVVAGDNDVDFNFSGVSTTVSIDRDGNITGTQDGTISGFAKLETTLGNLTINAENYVYIDSIDNGQIEIGRASGIGHVIIGNATNQTDIDLEGNVTLAAGLTFDFNGATVTGLSVSSLTSDSGDVVISTASPSGDDVRIQTVDDIELFAGDDIVIYTNYNSGSDKLFIFRSEGDIEFPDGTRQSTAWTGAYTPTTSSDWASPAPTTIEDALDRLATVVKALNGGTGA